ncbi:MAG: hypothetical protein Q9228_007422 [Teloschistes exilis]
MGTFPHRSPYSKNGDVRMVEENNDGLGSNSDADELEIDSDLSDADLLVRRAEAGEDQRDLAASTLANIERYRQLWALFCSTLLKGKPDPVSALGNCNVKGFKLFFVWYSTKYPRANRSNTFQDIWKGIHQVYYDTFRTAINKRLSHEFSNVLNDTTSSTKPSLMFLLVAPWLVLQGTPPHKRQPSETDFGLRRGCWGVMLPLNLRYGELALYVLFLAYTGARPGAILESNCKGIRGTNEALKYKDIQLKLIRPAGGAAPLLVMKLRIVLDKGRRKRGEEKTLALYENCVQPVMCPIVYFLALAFVDNAFHPELIQAGLSVGRLHRKEWIACVVDCLDTLWKLTMSILLHIFAFPYYAALKSNTLDVVEKINDETNSTAQDKLVKRFVLSRINESNIIFALVSVVTGAQQLWVLPNEDSLKAPDVDLEPLKWHMKNHKKRFVFAIQCPLMFFSYSVATFLSGLFSVVFSPLAGKATWSDDAQVAVFFAVVNVAVIIAFNVGTQIIYQIAKPKLALASNQVAASGF